MAELPPKTLFSYSSLFPSSPTSHWSCADELVDFSAVAFAAANTTMEASTPSGHYSGVNEDNKPGLNPPSSSHETIWSEAETSCNPPQLPVLDPKRVKRVLANRQSARRSRVRKLQYIFELEKTAAVLQTEVLALSPTVALLEHQRSILIAGNSHLKQCIAALAQDKIFKDAHQTSLKKEIERLKLIYQQQKFKKLVAMATTIDAGGDDAAAIFVQNELQANP